MEARPQFIDEADGGQPGPKDVRYQPMYKNIVEGNQCGSVKEQFKE